MTLIRYIGAHDEVVIDVAGREVDVKRGATVDVPAALAGTPPTAAFLAAEKALYEAANAVPRIHEVEAAAKAALIDVMEGSGTGWLAQYENWEAVAPAKSAKAEKDGE